MPDPKSRLFTNKDEAVVDDNASTDDSVEDEEQYDGYAEVEKMEVIILHYITSTISPIFSKKKQILFFPFHEVTFVGVVLPL